MRIAAIAAALAILALAPLAPALAGAGGGDEEQERRRRTELVGGVPVVHMDAELQRESGVETIRLEAATHVAERTAYGEVVDLQPLLEQRAAYRRLLADARALAAALEASRQEHDRLVALREQRRYVSEQDLVAARATWQGDAARADGIDVQLADLRAQLRQAWGPTLAVWALDGGSVAFDALLARTQVLLLVTLRDGETLSGAGAVIRVGRGDDPAQFQRAELVASAPRTDPRFQGETWFFRADAGRLRTGMRVDALIPAGEPPRAGVTVPLSAVVWHGGRPWVYLRVAAERFSRRTIDAWRETGEGWFVSGALEPGEMLVVRGAQMLLSEELRWQIPDEDDD